MRGRAVRALAVELTVLAALHAIADMLLPEGKCRDIARFGIAALFLAAVAAKAAALFSEVTG